jgi:hypothetical protein
MRRAVVTAVAVFFFAGASSAQFGGQVTSTSLSLQRVSVELPSQGVASVVLHTGQTAPDVKGPFTLQKLHVGNVEIPLFSPADVLPAADETAVRFEVQLKTVPEMVLALPLTKLPISWEGYTEGGLNKLAIAGEVNPADRGSVDVPVRTLYRNYSKIADVRMSTDGGKVLVRVLASLYNPFSFDIVASSLDYSVRSGDTVIVTGQRKGLRLRGQRWSDVLIEQEVSPTDAAAGGIAALLKPGSVQVEGSMSVRTPAGDRQLQIKLGGS